MKKKPTPPPVQPVAKVVPEKAKENEAPTKKVNTETSATPVASASSAEMAYRVIVKPLVTEKSALLQSQNHYTFVVANWVSKLQVKEAVKALYGVTPIAVNLVNVQGRRLRFGKSAGQRSDFKKAIITLPPGQSITIHQGV
ncbi:MAG: 50S ribosomal protein L23 [Candidatus Magasanikbacteria bacterium]|nr:50S ribosomal protein L23 [Candidatus Magasanikbacteria bacterium]